MLDPGENQSRPENRILASLSAEAYARLMPHLEAVELPLGKVLSEPDEPIHYVYFPNRGTISLVVMLADGSEVEAGVVGNEGMLGLAVALGTNSSPLQAIVQIPDGAMKLKASVLMQEFNRHEKLYDMLLRYSQTLFIQTAQTAACNRLHHLDGRLARWLLMCQERSKADDLQLTHEFLATMLGVRRAGVSVAAAKLQSMGLIKYTRGHIRVIDRKGLEAASCECYTAVKDEVDRLFASD